MGRLFFFVTTGSIVLIFLSGCWFAAAGVGAEAGYVASQEDRSIGETIDDQALVARVKTKLIADPKVSGLDINVDSFRGVITLKGVLKSEEEVEQAIQVARSTSGVKDVRSKLFVSE